LQVPKNVKILKWLPQNDILGHKNTKLFLTHCGNNGQYESLYHGVPMIGFPLFAEQGQNCIRAVEKGYGLQMDIHKFTADELVDNILNVIYRGPYKKTIGRVSEIWRDEPTSPRERATYWVEHVIKYGGRHLRGPAMDMPLYQFLMLDVIGFTVALSLLVLFLIKRFVKAICKKIRNRKTVQSVKKTQ